MLPEPEDRQATRLVFDSDPLAVREALRRLAACPPLCLLDDDMRGTAEIVLAEALNNVVEHAYAGRRGKIELWLRLLPGALE